MKDGSCVFWQKVQAEEPCGHVGTCCLELVEEGRSVTTLPWREAPLSAEPWNFVDQEAVLVTQDYHHHIPLEVGQLVPVSQLERVHRISWSDAGLEMAVTPLSQLRDLMLVPGAEELGGVLAQDGHLAFVQVLQHLGLQLRLQVVHPGPSSGGRAEGPEEAEFGPVSTRTACLQVGLNLGMAPSSLTL